MYFPRSIGDIFVKYYMTMGKTALIFGFAFGLFTVVTGAFGTHALRDLLEVNEMFETAVHTIAPIGGSSLVSGWISLMMTVRSTR